MSGLASPWEPGEKIDKRARAIGQQWQPAAYPVELLRLGDGGTGVPVRATVTSFGPDRPAATVFEFVGFEHVANDPRWDLKPQLEQVTDGPIGVGTVVRRHHTHFGRPMDGVMECLEFDPPRAIGFVINDGPVEMSARMSVEPEGSDRSMLTISTDMPDMDAPMDPRPVQESARRIKELIESER